MAADPEAVGRAARIAASPGASLELRLLGEAFPAESASVSRAPGPASPGAVRGGAYSSDDEPFRARVRLAGGGVVRLLPRAMLGPSGDSADAVLEARAGGECALLHSRVASAVEGPSHVELTLEVTSAAAC